jgi:hypothetical protein
MEEIWKDIKGFEGLYQVSNLGNVRNSKTKKQLYKNCNKTNDYLFVNLGKHNKKYIHRLVYETFKGFNNKDNIINHINSNKIDNRLSNLEECSYSYNLTYAYYNGERKLKPVNQYTLYGTLINTYLTGKEASKKTGVSASGICNCCKGKIKTAGGYIWRYANK